MSDGLVADLGHIVDATHCGALLIGHSLPLFSPRPETLTDKDCLHAALYGGDDYELCFTVPPDRATALPPEVLEQSSRIGEINNASGVWLVGESGEVVPLKIDGGYRHF